MRRVVRALLEHQSGELTHDATLVLVQWHGTGESPRVLTELHRCAVQTGVTAQLFR